MHKINIKLPDGTVKKYNKGITGIEIAKTISEGLSREVLSISVNNEIWDATRPLENDAKIKLLTWKDEKGKYAFWHSSAHLLAEALEELYPGIKFGKGPPIEKGFYYDVDFGDHKFDSSHLDKIEKKML